MIDTELGSAIFFLATAIRLDPKMLDMAKQQPRFPEIERTVVASIANADTIDQAVAAYDRYRSLVPDWKFVFSSDKGGTPGLSVNRTFSDGSVVRGLFSKERVLVLDGETRDDMLANNKAIYPFDYSIALDTQALSYLTPFLEGNTSSIADDFHEIFSFISKENVFVDPLPYMIENLPNVLAKEKVGAIRKKLLGYETLRTIDTEYFQETGEIRSNISEEELEEKVENIIGGMTKDASNPKVMASLSYRQNLMYCILLKMTAIQLANPRKSLELKLQEFIDFLDSELQTIFAREIIVAMEYFSRGQKLEFFSEIQKSDIGRLPKLLAKLKNMAWDFWHIRYIEGTVTIDGEISNGPDRLNARYFFPALLTCDKRFVEIIDLYPLKSYAYQSGGIVPVPFSECDWIATVAKESQKNFVDKYLSTAAIARRDEMRDQVECRITSIVEKLEKEFSIAALPSK